LLDWLASQLIRPDEGPPWRLKRIQRLIVTSATYRQASQTTEDREQRTEGSNPQSAIRNPQSIDADNRLLWRQLPRRLEAEAFRDAVLAASGDLDPRLGGPSFRDWTVKSAGDNENYTVFDAVGGEFNRRTIYRMAVRAGTSPLLDLLDCPDPSVPAPSRAVTTTPLQALSLLNGKFMEHSAQRFAERLAREAPDDQPAQIRRAYQLAFAREPDDAEIEFARKFASEHGLPQLCLVLLNASEFLYVD
jgi:hypothetical protein